jgi:hypothetical protein
MKTDYLQIESQGFTGTDTRQSWIRSSNRRGRRTSAALIVATATLVLGATSGLRAQVSSPSPQPDLSSITAGDYSVVERGPNHRVVQQVVSSTDALGRLSYTTNSYVELASGLHFQDPKSGNWIESQEVIEGFPGGAVARRGPIQMIFPNDLSSEPVDAQMPAGRFRSAVLCLSYADYGLQTNLIIAEIQPCQGQILAPNQVWYPAAFSNKVGASVRYTYRRDGWEQDILIDDSGSLPTPESMGLDSSSPTLMLQVTTEFLEVPPPHTSQSASAAEGLTLEDQTVDWGAMRLGQGQALFLGSSPSTKPVGTVKRWVVTPDNRQFLVEEVPFSRLLKAILSKPTGASLDTGTRKVRSLASLDKLPRLKPHIPNPRPMELAAARPPDRGLLIDFVTMSSSTNNYVFQCDTTYYVSGLVSLSGTTVCEWGTVIKFTNSPSAKISMSGPLICKGGQYRPIVMTSKDDNTVGQSISGSTGSPTNYNGATYLEDNNSQTNTYQNLRLSYAGIGLSAAIFSNGVWHCQFVKCGTAVNASGGGRVALHNVLMTQCTNGVITTGTLSAEHLTADQCVTLLAGTGSSGVLTNSVLTAVAAVTNVTLYNSAQLSTGSGVYQTVGAASYYLADCSTNRNAGTTNIAPGLLADLRKRTTYPPIVLTNNITTDTTLSPQAQRNSGVPDLGYAYDPLDYAISGLTLTNTLLLTNGVALGVYGTSGLNIRSGAKVVSQGTPLVLNRMVPAKAVQEQATSWGTGSAPTIFALNAVTTGLPELWLRFTELCFLANRGNVFTPISSTSEGFLSRFALVDCSLCGGNFSVGYSGGSPPTLTIALTNSLFLRPTFYISQDSQGDSVIVRAWNNLFRGGAITWENNNSTTTWKAYDNLFDRVTFLSCYSIQNSNNAYVTNYNKLPASGGSDIILTNSPVYQTSYLGSYYYPTNDGMLSTLINAGSRWATNAGLYHFTTQTNQVEEGATMVDIGFHSVAVDANGNPVDTNDDGLADYLSDNNGNGSVDSGEIGWNLTGDLGLKVLITRPRNGANPLP